MLLETFVFCVSSLSCQIPGYPAIYHVRVAVVFMTLGTSLLQITNMPRMCTSNPGVGRVGWGSSVTSRHAAGTQRTIGPGNLSGECFPGRDLPAITMAINTTAVYTGLTQQDSTGVFRSNSKIISERRPYGSRERPAHYGRDAGKSFPGLPVDPETDLDHVVTAEYSMTVIVVAGEALHPFNVAVTVVGTGISRRSEAKGVTAINHRFR